MGWRGRALAGECGGWGEREGEREVSESGYLWEGEGLSARFYGRLSPIEARALARRDHHDDGSSNSADKPNARNLSIKIASREGQSRSSAVPLRPKT